MITITFAMLGVLSGVTISAQNPPQQQESKTPSNNTQTTPQSDEGKKQEKAPAQAPSQPGQIRLETPQVEQTKKPAQPGQIQLETPKVEEEKKPSPEAAKQPRKDIIESIIFRGNRRIQASTLRARMFTHVGDVYDENALERDFMALWNTGFLDDIRLEETDGEKGKILTFFVREKKLIRSIDYKGMSTVQQSDVLDRYKDRKVPLSIQSQYDPVVVKRAEVVLQDLLAEHGRQFATVRARTRNIPPNSVALTFIVVEGPKVKMGDIRFKGNTVFSTAKLVRAMKYSRPAGAPPWFYWFHKTYDKDKIQADLEEIRKLYQDHGYFYVQPDEPQVKMVDTVNRWPFLFYSWGRGKKVNITIPIEEGDQYRLGKFTIRGNKLFPQKVLAPVLQLKTGDIFDLGKVRKSLENYTKLYGQFGYINFTANPDIEPDRKKKIINLALEFDEEKQFTVHRIEFTGNTKTRDKVIRRELLLDEGNIFSSTLWDYSILRINQLGFFNNVKKEDYEIHQNPKDSTVDIDLKVQEKGHQSIGFSGGVSGLAGNFVGLNYSTNNFLGLGETLSVEAQWGTFQKSYTFGFTEPYLFDRPITSGFTVFKSDYHYDQLQQLAASTNISPAILAASTGLGQYAQNFQQNSTGFSVYASYPLRRRAFARVGITYSYSVSSLQAFNTASEAYFQAINFDGLAGPNSLSGITTSQIMPTYMYNTVNDTFNPTGGKYLYAGLAFTGSFMGGNVNTITPTIEAKYYRSLSRGKTEKPHVLAMHFVGSTVSGFGGRVPPPFSRFYMGGEQDLRGFDIRTISPIAFYPSLTSVCNRDNLGNIIPAVGTNGQKSGSCGSSTTFPYSTPIFPGGDTQLVSSFEYRVPIAGPVWLAAFLDVGTDFIWHTSQLKLSPSALTNITTQFPYFTSDIPSSLKPIGTTNFLPRSSTGLQISAILPIVNAPVEIYYGYNWLRLDQVLVPPQALPPIGLFPNQATYNSALPFFDGIRIRERKGRVGFTVSRTF
ncbi:MAG TPA: outer membrane protein assembly factor BamA [Terriglobia bacterium]|nr:outer membrane protein assembly factor BamA [Terriglobia bacterium]